MMEKNVETFIGCDASFEEADIVIFGAPFDSTTSFRPGARFGSRAIRSESFGLETYSPYIDKDLMDYHIMDAGDLELPMGSNEKALEMIEATTQEILDANKFPFMIGGEHLVTLGQFRAIAKKYPDVHIVHFDAHCDLREDYLGVKLSHACVLRRCHDLIGDDKIYQYAIRSGERDEFEFAKHHTHLHPFDFDGLEDTVKKLQGKPVYFTLDLDCLDPSIFPGTGTPEAGGVTFKELLKALQLVGSLDLVGVDVNELAPMLDNSGVSTAVACKVVREILLLINKKWEDK